MPQSQRKQKRSLGFIDDRVESQAAIAECCCWRRRLLYEFCLRRNMLFSGSNAFILANVRPLFSNRPSSTSKGFIKSGIRKDLHEPTVFLKRRFQEQTCAANVEDQRCLLSTSCESVLFLRLQQVHGDSPCNILVFEICPIIDLCLL